VRECPADAGGIHGQEVPAAKVIKVMDHANVKKIVILTGMWGENLQHVIDEMVKPYPGRFMVFTQLDWSRIDDPNFGVEMVALLRDSVAQLYRSRSAV